MYMKSLKRVLCWILAVTMVLGLLPSTVLATSSTSFKDVKDGDWFKEAVEYVTAEGLMVGVGGNKFDPNGQTTRAMVVTVLYRMEEEPEITGTGFSDTGKQRWYSNAVIWAKENGIVNGYGDSTFRPDVTMTREEMVAVFYRYSEYKGYDITATKSLDAYSDRRSVQHYAVSAMEWAVSIGLITGFPDGTIRPQGESTRAQLATILMRLYQSFNVGVTFTVTFESNGGSLVDVQTVSAGTTATEPNPPVMENYSFAGWYSDADLTLAFDFTEPITCDITLFARWREIDNLEDEIIDLGDIANLVSNGKIEVIYDKDGNIRTIDGCFTDKKILSLNDAAVVLRSTSSLFGNAYSVSENNITCQTVGDGTTLEENYYRYTPRINGIPVLGSQIVIATDEDGAVTGLFSTFNYEISYVDTSATISQEEAINTALRETLSRDDVNAFFEGIQKVNVDIDEIKALFLESLSTHSELLIYAAGDNASPVLTFAVTVTNYKYAVQNGDTDIEESDPDGTIGTPVIDITYYLYANGHEEGNIFKAIENTEGWTTVDLEGEDLLGATRSFTGQEEDGTYRLKDTTRDITTYKTATSGALWWKEYILPGNIAKSSSFFWSERMDKSAVSAHANMTETFDFYNDFLGRKSFDGNSAPVKVSYNYGSNFENAYWTPSGQQFVFGSGGDYVAALDVVAHEYTHAVINYVVGNGTTTTLTYFGESGALNEAYADIMGSLVEGKSGAGLWTVGEDMGSIMRSMADPSAYGQPNHYSALSDPAWSAQLDRYRDRDNEGVHIFGGVYCHAVYLMMTDNRCDEITQKTWARVFYRSLFRLTTNASFLDGRGAVISAAKNLGFTQAQLQAIKDAFDDVGITEPDAIRIVLQWGEHPSDLDSHIVGPGIAEGDRFHVYYSQRNYYCDGTYESATAKYAVDLDYDDTTSFGPEVTTIHLLTPGDYYYYVHDYSNDSWGYSTDMAKSGATVKVYRGSSNVAIAEYKVDSSSCGTYWNVFKLTINDGMEIAMEPINTYGTYPSYS